MEFAKSLVGIVYLLLVKFFFRFKFFKPVWFRFPLVSDYDHEYKTKKNQNQTGLKKFKPTKKFNDNMYVYFKYIVIETTMYGCLLVSILDTC